MTLKIDQLHKSFAEKKVLSSISLDVAVGDFVSIIGPSGSGKSTIFNVIGGLLEPDAGTVELGGENITGKRGHISYMPQQEALLPWRTVLDNVLLGQELHGMREEERAREMLAFAGLGEVIDQYPHALSGGMKQRVAFIRALLSPQSLLCLDEPFSALDEFTRLDMQKWLLRLLEEHERTVLFITHSIDEALFLSDKIVVLSSNPATVKKVIDVPLARPRDASIVLSTEFLAWKKTVIDAMDENGSF